MWNDKKKGFLPAVIFVVGAATGAGGIVAAQHYQLHLLPMAKKLPPRDIASRLWWQQDAMNEILQSTFKQLREADLEDNAQWGVEKEIAMNETGHEFVYRIPIENIKGTNVHVDVQDGYVTVTARSGDAQKANQDQKGENKETQSAEEYYGLYKRTFPLVAGANPAKMEFSLEKDSVVIRFSKLKGA